MSNYGLGGHYEPHFDHDEVSRSEWKLSQYTQHYIIILGLVL